MTKIRVADYIANFLAEKNIKHIFLLSGGGMMHLLDAVSRHPSITYICNHHEQASAMAAEAYARVTGHLGVCYATSGPGATNIITGLIGAWQDSAPVLFITGQSKLAQTIQHSGLTGLRQFGTFEVDIVPIVQSITKYADFVRDPKLIKKYLDKAYRLATTGRPGPVLLDIPVDIQGALIDPNELETDASAIEDVHPPTEDKIRDVVKRLLTAKRPLILAGHGIRMGGAATAFRQLIESLNIPTVTTQLAKDLLTYDHSLFIGHPGMKGDRAGNFAVQHADVILSLGCSLHVLTTGYELDKFAPDAYKIQVDIDPNILEREQVRVNEKINSDVQFFIDQALRMSKTSTPISKNNWHDACLQWKHELAVFKEPHQRMDTEINYYDFIETLSERCQGGEIIVTDAGSAFYVVGHAFRCKKDQRVIVSGALGAMGYALPAATGASISSPDKNVICITGDGSLQTNIHDLATIRFHDLNIKVFVLNNNGYVSIKNTQTNFFDQRFAGVNKESGVSFPNLQKLAAAYDIPYTNAHSLKDLPATMNEVLSSKGPLICEIFSSKHQEIIPTVSSQKLPDGKMISKNLDDMYPFMGVAEREKYLSAIR